MYTYSLIGGPYIAKVATWIPSLGDGNPLLGDGRLVAKGRGLLHGAEDGVVPAYGGAVLVVVGLGVAHLIKLGR